MKAFPNIELTVSELGQIRKVYASGSGMDLRDYFAAKAMQGMFANSATKQVERTDLPIFAKVCYEMADAMIEARSK